MKRLLKWFFILLLVLLLLALLTLGAVWFLAGTDKGFNFAARQAVERVDGLELDSLSGNLARGISSDSVQFSNDAIAVDAKGLSSDWRLGCLLKREFCLDRLVVEELDLETFANDAPKTETSGDIELPAIALPIDVTAKEVLVKRLRFQPPGGAPEQVLENVRLAVRTEGSHVYLDDASVQYQNYAAKVTGDVELDGDYPLELAIKLDASDVVDEHDVSLNLALGNTARELDVNGTLSGAVSARVTGRVLPLQKDLPVQNLVVKSAAAGWPLDSRAQVEATDFTLTIDGTLDDYLLSLTTNVNGEQIPATSVSLSGRANTERLDLSEVGVATLGGTLNGNASLSWKDGIAWLTELDIANIDPSRQIQDLAGKLNGKVAANGRVEEGNWTLDVQQASIDGVLRDYPFQLDAKVQKGLDNVWQVEQVKLDNGRNRVTANGSVSDVWDLKVNADLPQLRNLLPDLGGGFQADVSLSGALTEPDVTLSARSPMVKFQENVIQGFSLDATVAKAAMLPSSLALRVSRVSAGDNVVSNARLDLTGSRAEHELKLFADGPQQTAIDLVASGALDNAFNWNGLLQRVKLEVPAHNINLREPTAIAWQNETKQLAIDPHCWVTEGSNLCLVNKVLAEKSGSAVVSLDQYLLERLNPFLPAETTLLGALKADATINWGTAPDGAFSASISTEIDDGGFNVVDANQDPVNFAYDKLTLDATIDPANVTASLKLASKNLGDAAIDITLDPSTDEKPINGTVKLDGLNIAVARAFLPQFDQIEGTLNASGDLSGRLTDPRFDGNVILDQPVFVGELLPMPIDGGRITTNIRGKRAFIDGKLTSGDGNIAIEGDANWQQASWRADVTLTGETLRIVQQPVTDSTVNPVIRINASPGNIRVNGDIDIPFATIDIVELPKGAATLSDDVIIIEDIEEDAAAETIDPPGDTRLNVAINVSLGDEVKLSGYGLDANLTGDMSVALRSPNPPQLGGEIKVVRGIYKQYGQNLKADGQILFVGPVNQTRLDIDAIREIEQEDRIAGLRIGGTVAGPEISLFTDPGDKSEDAILSYIILGRDINETSDQEANLLATAALALTVKGGRNLAGGIAESLGVKEFGLETRGRGDDTELVVSGRLNDRLLLRYGRSVFEPEQTLYLRYDLSKKLYLEAAQGAESAVDLFYSFSF